MLSPPDRSQLKEIFRRFEFRSLLSRLDTLDEALPAAPAEVSGVPVRWREGELDLSGRVGYAAVDDRAAVATPEGVTVGPRPAKAEGELVMHDAKSAGVDAADDTLLMAYLIEPARSTYALLRPRPRVRHRAHARPGDRRGDRRRSWSRPSCRGCSRR